MKKEEILRGISEILKKHEDYLNDNPEVFYTIEDRLFKAIDYEDWEGEEDPEEDEEGYGEGYGDDLFDRVPSEDEEGVEDIDEEDEASRWLAEQEQQRGETGDNTDVAEDRPVQQEAEEEPKQEAPAEVSKPSKPSKRSSRYLDWQPRSEYSDEHSQAIQEYMDEGYSHREAERLAGAHEAPSDFHSALRHTVNPSEPSPKMLEQMKELSYEWLKGADRKQMETAEAGVNPIKYATGKSLSAHEEAHKDFSEAYSDFISSDEVKGLKGRERHKAIRAWKQDWRQKNPEYREKAIQAAGAGKHFGEAGEARRQRREEGTQAILEAGKSGGQDFGGGYSEAASGAGEGKMSDQMAAQMVGGVKGESGYQANIQKDPAAVFAERNPDYIKSLRDKAAKKLDPEQTKRMSAIDSFKKKGTGNNDV